MKKEFEIEQIKYNYEPKFKKWHFRGAAYELALNVKGAERAGKVAKQIAGALKRTKNIGLDNLARGQINKILV
jgi:hypothetical protein